MTLTLTLHRIHEGALDLVEDDDAEEEEDGHEGEGIAKGEPGEIAFTKGSVFEGLDDGGHRVQHDQCATFLVGHHAQWINDRRGIHPQLDDEAKEDGEVTVFGGHRGDEDAEAET